MKENNKIQTRKKRTQDFQIETNTRFQDDKRDITVIEQRKNKDKNGRERRYYKYHCNVCGFSCGKHYKNGEYKEELLITESNLLNKNTGCSCCDNKITVIGINSIVDTDKWMIPYFQGGYDEAKLYTCHSNKSINAICPDCGRVKDKLVRIGDIFIYNTLWCTCSDNIPYPEKFMFSVLEQLKLNFEIHKVFDWSNNNNKLHGRKEYDFYLNNYEILIETHGNQHYEEQKRGRSLADEVENDEFKKQLASDNNISEINYIVINCKKSTLEWIRDHILDSELSNIFDLSKIDWLKCAEFACSNLVKKACEYKRNNSELTTVEIGKMIGYNSSTIRDWLKQGREIGWCLYDEKTEKSKSMIKNSKNSSKQLLCLTTKNMFESTYDCERKSEKIFGVKLSASMISKVCRGLYKHYKGFKFKYISDLTNEEKQQYNIL